MNRIAFIVFLSAAFARIAAPDAAPLQRANEGDASAQFNPGLANQLGRTPANAVRSIPATG